MKIALLLICCWRLSSARLLLKRQWEQFKLAEEAAKLSNGFMSAHFPSQLRPNLSAPSDLPESVDWRTKGAVTPVKNQGQCMSCWAFSATGALEGQLFRKRGRPSSLSEQQLVDCSTDFGNGGCHGGVMNHAFNFVKAKGGLTIEQNYPYRGQVESCNNSTEIETIAIRGHTDLPVGDEEALKAAVATVGPVSVALSANTRSFLYYGGGILEDDSCNPKQPDHGMLVVGYGREGDKEYWILKNSWGSEWGEQGYLKLGRGTNLCGVASAASFPLL